MLACLCACELALLRACVLAGRAWLIEKVGGLPSLLLLLLSDWLESIDFVASSVLASVLLPCFCGERKKMQFSAVLCSKMTTGTVPYCSRYIIC